VGARLFDAGQPIAAAVAPVGDTLSSEDLNSIDELERLEELYNDLAEEAATMVIQPNQLSRFTVVFADLEGVSLSEQLTYDVGVVQTEHQDEYGAWRRIVYNPELFETANP
jgi:hypothetical protein